MILVNNGAFYTVLFNSGDSEYFSRNWPCSDVRGSGSFTFDKINGDLVDMCINSDEEGEEGWAAFSQDCQEWGESKLEGWNKSGIL